MMKKISRRASIFHLFVLTIVSVTSMIFSLTFLSDGPCVRDPVVTKEKMFVWPPKSATNEERPGIDRCARFQCSHRSTCTTLEKHCCASILKAALSLVDLFFRRHQLNYVVIYGTLLGAVRNGTIIPWTQDIDIGFFNRSYLFDKAIRDELYQHGFHLFEVKSHCERTFDGRRSFAFQTASLTRLCIHKDAASFLVPQPTKKFPDALRQIQQIPAYVDLYVAWKKSDGIGEKPSIYSLEFAGSHHASISFRTKVKIDGKSYPTVDNVQEHLIHFYGKDYMRDVIPKSQ